MRRSLLCSSAALAAALLASSGAWAQCTDNFNFRALNVPSPGQSAPVSVLVPLGAGSSLSALTSTINTINTAYLTTTSAFVSAPGGTAADQQGGGAWGRTIVGTVDTNTSSTGTLSLPGGGATGTQNCNTTTRQDYWGYQVGHDISVLNGGNTGANWHFGVTAGYFEAKTKDITPAGSYTNANFPGETFNTPAGSFSADTQVPFVGIYTAFTKGGLFLDGQARWDWIQNSLSDPNNGLFGQQLDAQAFSLTGNAGYNIPVHNNWFIEPSAGVVWSRVSIDPLNVAGALQTAAPFFPYARGTVNIDDVDSVLGRATLRVGTSFTHAGVAYQPFATASVFHEFAGDVTARSTVTNTITPATPTSAIEGISLTSKSTGGVGTYGQFALGSAAAILNTGWLGYARVDYRIGENIEGWSVNAGLRYQFTPDQHGSIKDGPVPTDAVYNWTGAYVGAFAGRARGDEQWTYTNGSGQVDPEFAGNVVGGQAGYNVQVGKLVFGVEGDYGFSNAIGGKSCPAAAAGGNGFFFTCDAEADRLASITGRLGITWGRALFYGKGGWAAGDISASAHLNPGTAGGANIGVPLALPVKTTNWANGWTVGGGMEFALTNNWSAKAEYMHFDLGSDRYQVNDIPETVDAATRGDVVRVGINYHFQRQAAPVPLK
jgi:opacity protein-like surface antigen